MSSVLKVPPVFREDEMDYDQWKKDLELWTHITELSKENIAIAIHLGLSGRARQASSEISVADMKSVSGLQILLKKLDRVFLQDENWKCFNNYLAFENYRRDESISIDNFLSEFDRRHHKLKECGVELPDAVVACRLIKSCNLSEMHFQLALSTTPKMTFEDMRNTLKKLFAECGNKIACVTNNPNTTVKVENAPAPVYTDEVPALYGEQYESRPHRYADNRGRGHGRYRRGNYSNRGNPVGRGGRVTSCFVCGSTKHWARECPRSNADANYTRDEYAGDEVHITLMATETNFDDKACVLMGETIGSIVLDSGCSKTVCGSEWLDSFMDTLTTKEKSSINKRESCSVFRFGDGRRMESQKCVDFPCVLAGKSIRIKTDVVACNIPLLLSKSSMKRAGMIINLKNDTVDIFGNSVKLNTTSMGHYVLPIFRCPTPAMISEILIANDVKDYDSIASKLHRQFAHPSADRLSKLLRDAGRDEEQLHIAVEKITTGCVTCRRFKKVRPRPVVSMPMASKFNGTLAMDLKSLNGTIIFVMVDMCTRYCVAQIIKNKTADIVAQTIFTAWIAYFGAPSQILSDNGGEFNNEVMRSMGDFYNIRILCTAAESPWSNGLCERLNGILSISTQRVMDDVGCSITVALAWAVAARNTLHNFGGYAPAQLAFGHNPVYPNLCESNPPALEVVTTSNIIAQNLNSMHSARREFLKCESDEKVRRALLHQVREDDVKDITMGDNVYFKRQDDKWHGPGKVIGRDGKQVLVKHGGAVIRVHSFRLQSSENPSNVEFQEIKTDEKCRSGVGVPCDLDDDEDYHQSVSNIIPSENIDSGNQTIANDQIDDNYILPANNMQPPRIGERIQFVDKEGENCVAKVVSRAGKATGQYKYCYNIEKTNGDQEWIDLYRNVQKWRSMPNDNDVLITCNNDNVHRAKMKELVNWKENEVFDEVEDNDQKTISLRWVITEKIGDNNEPIIKARLVARGFEENMVDEHRRDSPTCTKDSLRLMFTVVASNSWKCNSIDIKAAFLQGNKIERDIFVKPPKEFYSGSIWKLKKNVYGLNDAARAWYFRMKDFLLSLNMKACSVDPAVFYYLFDAKIEGIICIHVDDIFWAGTSRFSEHVIKSIHVEFRVGSESAGTFKYIGLEIEGRVSSIVLSQHDYVNNLKEVSLSAERKMCRSSSLGTRELEEYRGVVGQLIWLANQTRPEIAFDVCELSTHCHNATVDDAINASKVVRKVKSRLISLEFHQLEDLSQLSIECYCDASFGNLSGGGSQGSYLIFITDSRGRRNILSWQSKKVRRVVKSTLAAETLALLDGVEASILFSSIIAEVLNLGVNRPIVKCYVDNRSLVEAVYSTKVLEDKLLRINMAVLRDLLSRRELHEVIWVQTSCQLADALTKRGANAEPLLEAVSNRH